jgi:hypothetical protein
MMSKSVSTTRFLSPVVLAALVLCNAYKGKFVSSITSPVLPKTKATFEKLPTASYKLFVKFDSSARKALKEIAGGLYKQH